MAGKITVCSYNMGSGFRDHLKLDKYQKKLEAGKKPEEEFDVHFANQEECDKYQNTTYPAIEQATLNALIESGAQLFCLQEVLSEDRTLVKGLREKGYEIVHFRPISKEEESPARFDTAIAFDKNRFSLVKDRSVRIEEDDVAIGVLKDKTTKKMMTVASAHIPGFTLSEAEMDPTSKNGVGVCSAWGSYLVDANSFPNPIIGADMNASPEIALNAKCGSAFKALEDLGFHCHRTSAPTNVNPNHFDLIEDAEGKKTHEREIDYFFTRATDQKTKSIVSRFISWMLSFFRATKSYSNPKDEITDMPVLDKLEKGVHRWDETKNASDHRPIFLQRRFEILKEPSKISKLRNFCCKKFFKHHL